MLIEATKPPIYQHSSYSCQSIFTTVGKITDEDKVMHPQRFGSIPAIHADANVKMWI